MLFRTKRQFPTRYSPVRHSPCGAFDLHVLSTPPAFVLSQDQTLRFDTQIENTVINLRLTDTVTCLQITIYEGRLLRLRLRLHQLTISVSAWLRLLQTATCASLLYTSLVQEPLDFLAEFSAPLSAEAPVYTRLLRAAQGFFLGFCQFLWITHLSRMEWAFLSFFLG